MSEKVNQEEIKEVDERGELSTPNVEYSIIKVDDQLLSIEGANYKLQKNYQNAFDLAQFKERYTDLFEKFDYIVGMDDQNIRALNYMTSSGEEQAKIIKMTDFLQKFQAVSVPDPYYEGDAGFVKVIDLLEDACEGLFRHLQIKDFGNK